MDIQRLISSYVDWLKAEISVARYGEHFELTTPYLDRFNDYLQLYIKQEDSGKIVITDDGYIIENLLSSGISLNNHSKYRQVFDKTLHNYSLSLEGDKITSTATIDNFSQKTHLFIQAMLAFQTMFLMNELFEPATEFAAQEQ